MFSTILGELNWLGLPAEWKATLAQLVERLIRNQQVAGSIPAGGSRILVSLAEGLGDAASVFR